MKIRKKSFTVGFQRAFPSSWNQRSEDIKWINTLEGKNLHDEEGDGRIRLRLYLGNRLVKVGGKLSDSELLT
jgi:hypothetical protein